MDDEIHLPPFEYGKHTVEAWGHPSVTADQRVEMIWSIRVDNTWLGSLSTSTDETREVVIQRVKHWIIRNLAKQAE